MKFYINKKLVSVDVYVFLVITILLLNFSVSHCSDIEPVDVVLMCSGCSWSWRYFGSCR